MCGVWSNSQTYHSVIVIQPRRVEVIDNSREQMIRVLHLIFLPSIDFFLFFGRGTFLIGFARKTGRLFENNLNVSRINLGHKTI